MDDLSNPGDAEPRASLTDIHDTIGDPTKDSKDSKLRIGRDISPKQSIANNGAPLRSSRPQTPQSNSNQRNVSISILFPILLAFAFAVFRSSPFSTNSLKILPTSYAICSRSKKIYTIAREGEAVECFVVKAGYVVDVGDLDDIRERWGDLDSWGSLSIVRRKGRSQEGERRNPVRGRGLKIFHIPPKQSVLPGESASSGLLPTGAR
jgi:hypothetical protein